jgi:hypothetical protein
MRGCAINEVSRRPYQRFVWGGPGQITASRAGCAGISRSQEASGGHDDVRPRPRPPRVRLVPWPGRTTPTAGRHLLETPRDPPEPGQPRRGSVSRAASRADRDAAPPVRMQARGPCPSSRCAW